MVDLRVGRAQASILALWVPYIREQSMLLPASPSPLSLATTEAAAHTDDGGAGDRGRTGGGAYGSAYGTGTESAVACKEEQFGNASDALGEAGKSVRSGARGWLWRCVEAVVAAMERFYQRWRQPLVVWILLGCELAVIAMITTAVRSNGLKRKNHHQHHHSTPTH